MGWLHYAVCHVNMPKLRFQFRLVPALAALLGMMLFVYLGLWQSGKGDRLAVELAQRAARHQLGPVIVHSDLLDAQALRDAPISVVGRYLPEQQFFLDNRQENGQAGVHVITPLQIEGTQTLILVNRGWVGWPNGRGVLPVVSTPVGRITLTGLAAVPSTKEFFLMPKQVQAESKLWSRLDMKRAAAQLKSALQPVVLLQNSEDAQDGLIRHWEPPQDRVGLHRGYAFQWFGMAAALFVFYLGASLRKGQQA
jgi:surfeit locus 1 family protein